jgi:RHS repeat-associated protein
VDPTGVVTLRRDYDPWGNTSAGATTSGWAYTGREWDAETDLYYYRARYYDSSRARFNAQDPAGQGAENLYAYAANSPIRLSDPLGLRPGQGFWTPEDAVIDTFQYIADNSYQYKWDAWEWGGMVCEINGCFCCTEPITDHLRGQVEPRRSPCKNGTTQVGWYHTHTPDSLPGFSRADRFRSSPSQDNVPAYALQTSDGKVLKYVWAAGSSAYTIIGQVRVPKLD